MVLDPDLTIGFVEGGADSVFGDVKSVVADNDGRVYVGDGIGATIRAYDADGAFLGTIAREGGGPGEIHGWPADLAAAPDGGFYARDGSRVTIFVPRGSGRPADSVAEVWPVPGYGNLTTSRGRVGRSGEYYYPGGLFRRGERPRYYYFPIRDGVIASDTLDVPHSPQMASLRAALYPLGATDAMMISGVSHVPFAALPAWDVTPSGTVVSSDASSYVLVETDVRGDTLRVIHGPVDVPREISATERADSARALQARIDSLRFPIDELMGVGEGVREGRLPATLPSLIGIHVAEDQTIWVEQWPEQGGNQYRFYDVFDPSGAFRERVTLRAALRRDPPPFFGSKYIVGIVIDTATDVHGVVRFTRK